MTVDLSCLDIGLCFIVEGKTGVTYTNQTGGLLCDHPMMEGALVPLMRSFDKKNDPLLDHYENDRNESTQKRFERVAQFLSWANLDERMSPRGDSEVMEAWVPVVVRSDIDKWDVLRGLAGMRGVLTYVNSD